MSQNYRVLTDADAEQFLARGFVRVREAFTREQAAAWTGSLWTRLGYDPADRATWASARIHMPVHHRVEVKAFAPKAWDAICDLMGGEERIAQPCLWGDGFIVNLGTDEDAERWELPSAAAPGWHKDGDWFRHFLDSPEQGLLTLVCWSDIRPRGGATFVAAGSVGPVARFLAAHPEGVHPHGFDYGPMLARCTDFVEAVGDVGDVYLLHPFLLHASSRNAFRDVRLITNPAVHFAEPMCFDRPDGAYSLVEQAILRGLGVERLEFLPTVPRERIVPERERIQAKMKEAEAARLAGG